MLTLLLSVVLSGNATAAGGCPDLSSNPVRLPEIAASCLGDATRVYAVRRDGEQMLIKRINLSPTSEQRAQARNMGATLKAASLEAGKVYLMWDPPVQNQATAKIITVQAAWDALK